MPLKFPAFFVCSIAVAGREFGRFETPDPMFRSVTRFSRRGAIAAAWRLLTRRSIEIELRCTDPALASEVFQPIANRLRAWNPGPVAPDSVTQSAPDTPRTPR